MLIRFKRLVAHNATTWEKLDINFENQGLVLIRGNNGTGKSNILELLSAVIYNKTTKSGQNNDLINRAVGSEYRVLLEISRQEDNGWVDYDILCCRKCKGEPTGIRIWRKGEEDPITPVKKPVQAQKMVAELIGMSYDEFQAVVSLGHESTHPLIGGTDTTRSEYISSTFGLDYEEYFEAVSFRLKQIDSKLSHIEDSSSQLKVWTTQLKELGDMESKAKRFRRLKSLILESDDLIHDLSKKDKLIYKRMEGQIRRNKLIRSIGAKPSVSSSDISDDISRLRKKIHMLEAYADRWDKYVSLKKQVSKLEAQISKVNFNPNTLKKAERALYSLEDKIAMHDSLATEDVCPTCKQDISGVVLSVSKLSKIKNRVTYLNNKISRIHRCKREYDRNKDIEYKISSLKKSMRDVKPDIQAKNIDRKIFVYNKKLEDLYSEHSASLHYDTCAEEIRSLPKGDHKKTHNMLRSNEARLNKERKRNKVLRHKKSLLSEEIRQYRKITSAISKLNKTVSGLDNIQKQKVIFTGLHAAFGKNGIKRDRVREILSLIADHLHFYTKSLLPRYEFRLIENEKKTSFVAVNKADGTEGDVRSLSKGEKKRLSVSLLLTERDIRRVKTNILFLDEFDGGIDEKGIPELLDILAELKSDYESIFAITHNPEIKQFDGFNKKFEVKRFKSFSKIRKMRNR